MEMIKAHLCHLPTNSIGLCLHKDGMHHVDFLIDVVKNIIIIETLKQFLLKYGKWTRSNVESIYHF